MPLGALSKLQKVSMRSPKRLAGIPRQHYASSLENIYEQHRLLTATDLQHRSEIGKGRFLHVLMLTGQQAK